MFALINNGWLWWRSIEIRHQTTSPSQATLVVSATWSNRTRSKT